MKYKTKFILCGSLLAQILFAQETPETLAPEQVTLAGVPKGLDEQYLQVSLIEKEQIERSGSNNLAEILMLEPGVEIITDPALQTRYIALNGLGAEHVKIMIDGVPLPGTVSGKVNIDDIPVSHIEQIEIVKSPMSAEHGSSIGGVVNICTAKKAEMGWGIALNQRVEFPFGLMQSLKMVNRNALYNLQVEGGWSDLGLIEYSDHRAPLRNPKSRWNVGGTLQWNYGPILPSVTYKFSRDLVERLGDLTADSDPSQLEYNATTGQFESSDSLANDLQYTTERHLGMLLIPIGINANNEINAEFSMSHWARQSEHRLFRYSTQSSTEIEGGTESTYRGYRTALKSAHYDLKGFDFNSGLLLEYTSAQGDRIINNEQSLLAGAFFFGLEWNLNKYFAVATSHRYEWNDTYDVKVTNGLPWVPAIAVKSKISELINFRTSYSKGYRAPNLQELYFSYHDGGSHDIDGNPNLAPETSDYISAGFEVGQFKKHHGIKSSVDGFYNSVRDKIITADNPDILGYSKYFNLNSVKVLGITWETRGKYAGFDLSITPFWGATTRVNEKGKATNDWDMQKSVSLKADYTLNSFSVAVSYKWNGEAIYFSQENGEWQSGSVDSWHWLNGSTSYHFEWVGLEVAVTAGIKNILDVKDLKTNGVVNPGGHSSGNSQALGEGRIYFTALNIQLK